MSKLGNNIKSVALDTNCFIYLFNSNSPFHEDTKRLFLEMSGQKIHMLTSIITLIELLSLQQSDDVLARVEAAFLNIPDLDVIDVNRRIALDSARIRRKYGLRLADATQLGTALIAKADAFLTNDIRLKKFKEVHIVLLKKSPRTH